MDIQTRNTKQWPPTRMRNAGLNETSAALELAWRLPQVYGWVVFQKTSRIARLIKSAEGDQVKSCVFLWQRASTHGPIWKKWAVMSKTNWGRLVTLRDKLSEFGASLYALHRYGVIADIGIKHSERDTFCFVTFNRMEHAEASFCWSYRRVGQSDSKAEMYSTFIY